MKAEDIKARLGAEYPYRIEMHAHTAPQSKCGELAPDEVVELYARKGFDAIVLTNHFMGDGYMVGENKEEKVKEYLRGFEEARAAGEKCGIKVYLGLEIRFSRENDNDYLIYGADEEIVASCYDFLEGSLLDFRENMPLPKSVFLQAHPFRDSIERVNPELLDGIETFNMHPGQNSRICFAARYAEENGMKIRTCGSDFHHRGLGHEAVSALRTKVLPKDSFELAEILRTCDYIFEVGGTSLVLP